MTTKPKRKYTHSKPKAKKSPYAGETTCLKCESKFFSLNKREFRICPRCKEDNKLVIDDHIFFMQGIFDEWIK